MDKELSELDIQFIKGVGPARAKLFSRLGIKTVYDAFHHLPCRYEDRSRIKKICTLQYGTVENLYPSVRSSRNSIRKNCIHRDCSAPRAKTEDI
jgi:ATP-dependent DNA helicase RecG